MGSLLPALLPLLDGTRSLEELSVQLGTTVRPAIEQALELLAANGLLVDGPDVDPDRLSAAHFLAAAYELSPSLAFERLRSATIGVVGSARAGVEVMRLLRAAGVGEIRALGWADGALQGVDLVVVAPSPAEAPKVVEWNLLALDTGVVWLGLRPYDGSISAVGPLVVPRESCCYECVLLRLAAHLQYGRDVPAIDAVPVVAGSAPALEAVAAGVCTQLVLCWIGGRDAGVPGVMFAVESRPLVEVTAHAVLRVPRCAACSPVRQRAPRLPWHEAEVEAR